MTSHIGLRRHYAQIDAEGKLPEFAADNEDPVEDEGQKCRACGCTDLYACDDGCQWVEEDLCSNCVGKEAQLTRCERRFVEAESVYKPLDEEAPIR